MTVPSIIPMTQVAARRAVKWNSGSRNSRGRELREFWLKFPASKWPSRVISGIPEVFRFSGITQEDAANTGYLTTKQPNDKNIYSYGGYGAHIRL